MFSENVYNINLRQWKVTSSYSKTTLALFKKIIYILFRPGDLKTNIFTVVSVPYLIHADVCCCFLARILQSK